MTKTADELKGDSYIIAAQKELREEIEEANDGIGPCYEVDDDEQALLDFDGESEVGGDWSYGETLIADHEFENYAEELARDIGAIGDDSLVWPLTFIDWKAAADALKQDYTTVDFLGTSYLVRAG